MNASQTKVLIVGAGPVGMATALLLRQHGIPSILIDQSRSIYRLPRAVHLDDEVVRILQSIGLEQSFLRLSKPTLGMKFVDSNLKNLLSFARNPDGIGFGFPEANMFHQPHLDRMLRNEVRRHSEIQFYRSTKMIRMDPMENGQWQITCQNTKSNETMIYHTEYLLAADGADSPIRTMLNIPLRDLGYHQKWLVVDLVTDKKLDIEWKVQQVCHDTDPYTFVPVTDRRFRWEFLLTKPLADTEISQWVKTKIDPWMQGMSYRIQRSAIYTFHSLVAKQMCQDNVFLLGDAAHQTPPFLGQGVCAGIRDAQNLAWRLSWVIKGVATNRILEEFEKERIRHVTSVIRLAILAGRILNPYPAVIRKILNRILAGLSFIPFVRSKIAETRVPDLSSLWNLAKGRSRACVGRMLPQPLIYANGLYCLLDQALGNEMVFLTIDADDFRNVRNVLTDTQRLGITPILIVSPTKDWQEGIDRRAQIADCNGVLTDFFKKNDSTGMFVRPDRYVAAAKSKRQNMADVWNSSWTGSYR